MSTITARVAVAGLHRWPTAPPSRFYLAHPHRHLFRVAVTVAVAHDDRSTEFHDLADDAVLSLTELGKRYHPSTPLVDFGDRSCEVLAAQLAKALSQRYDLVSVTVSEDGENDGTWNAQGPRTPGGVRGP